MSQLQIVREAISRGLHINAKGEIISHRGKILAHRSAGKGYRMVGIPNLRRVFRQENVYVHKLVYYLMTNDDRVFNPEYEIHHLNGVRDDNRFENLELMLAREHESRTAKLNQHNAKITRELALQIKAEYLAGDISQRKLALKYGLSQQHISDIVTGKKWGAIWD